MALTGSTRGDWMVGGTGNDKEEMAGDAFDFCGERKTLNGANTN
jgi:hypothetical protein